MNQMNAAKQQARQVIGQGGMGTQGRLLSAAVFIIRYILPLAALGASVLITLHLLQTRPQAKPMVPRHSGVPVETLTATSGSYPTLIHAMGVVQAARSIELKPQVSGQVVAVGNQFIPGGRFYEGDILLKLDPADYELALIQQENAVTQAQNNLDIEEGNQLVVKREFDLLGESVTEAEKRLMLRQPQLSTLETELSIARAKKDQAQLNLSRTTIKAPFNGIVRTRDVNIGTWVSSSSGLGTLVGSDCYWVEVSVPEEQLRWITIPDETGGEGSGVKIYNPTAWDETIFRSGTVDQLLPGLESQGRMARLLIEVNDPLGLETTNAGKPQLLIDSFVRVIIEGKPIHEAVEVSREHLRNGDQLWVFDQGERLAIREVSVAFKNRDTVLITEGLRPGEEIITSNISTPVEGMELQRMNDLDLLPGSGRKADMVAMNRPGNRVAEGGGNEQ